MDFKTAASDLEWMNVQSTPRPIFSTLVILAFVLTATFYAIQMTQNKPQLLNPPLLWDLTNSGPRHKYYSGVRQMLHKWFSSNPDQPVRLISDLGEMMVLPSHMAHEISKDQRLSFSRWAAKALHTQIPGFEVFGHSHLVETVVAKNLTKSLGKVTKPISDEIALALPQLFTDSDEWHAIPLRDTVLRLVNCISSRVFLGEELCRNPAWLDITLEYTVTSIAAIEQLRQWPTSLRSIVHWFLPSCRKVRAKVEEARRVLGPVRMRRLEQKQIFQDEGRERRVPDDAIEWFEQSSNDGSYDPVCFQLMLSTVSIHTTTELLSQIMLDLAQNPDMLEPLRKEITCVLQTDGWQNSSFHKMKLLDSVIKESLRMKPTAIAVMRRVANENLKLSDDTYISKNSVLAVSSHQMWDERVHTDPEQWDGYRFYKMSQQPGKEKQSRLIHTSPDYLAFGYGRYACPGRFFAGQEIKIAMIHLLFKYDWRLPEKVTPRTLSFGFGLGIDPSLDMIIRRRQGDTEIQYP